MNMDRNTAINFPFVSCIVGGTLTSCSSDDISTGMHIMMSTLHIVACYRSI